MTGIEKKVILTPIQATVTTNGEETKPSKKVSQKITTHVSTDSIEVLSKVPANVAASTHSVPAQVSSGASLVVKQGLSTVFDSLSPEKAALLAAVMPRDNISEDAGKILKEKFIAGLTSQNATTQLHSAPQEFQDDLDIVIACAKLDSSLFSASYRTSPHRSEYYNKNNIHKNHYAVKMILKLKEAGFSLEEMDAALKSLMKQEREIPALKKAFEGLDNEKTAELSIRLPLECFNEGGQGIAFIKEKFKESLTVNNAIMQLHYAPKAMQDDLDIVLSCAKWNANLYRDSYRTSSYTSEYRNKNNIHKKNAFVEMTIKLVDGGFTPAEIDTALAAAGYKPEK